MKRAALALTFALLALAGGASAFSGASGHGARALHQTFDAPLTSTPTCSGDGSTAWTFTRADAATCASYINSTGLMAFAPKNEARFDYDPVTLKALGYLSEGSRTNNVLASTGQPGRAPWSQARLLPDGGGSAIIAPDGTSTTTYIAIESTANGLHAWWQNISHTNGTKGTLSFFVKGAGRTNLCTEIYNTNDPSGILQFFGASGTGFVGSAGAATGTSFWSTAVSTAEAPLGWTRCVVTTGTGTGHTTAILRFDIAKADGTTLPSYAGDGSSSIYIWGVQWEDNATFASSFIGPTTTTALTRAADVLTYSSATNVPLAGGTAMLTGDMGCLGTDAAHFLSTRTSSPTENGLLLFNNSSLTNFAFQVRSGGTVTAIIYTGARAIGAPYRYAGTWGSGLGSIYVNGLPGSVGTETGSPSTQNTSLFIGCSFASAGHIFGHIRDLRIWNVALTAREIATINAALGTP